MDCLRCNHRMPLEQVERGRKWHNECPKVCEDTWCSHPDHEEDRKVVEVGRVEAENNGKKEG